MEFDCGLRLATIFRLTPHSVVFKSLADFSSKFSSLVHSCFCRPWMSGKPMDFQPVGYHIGGLLTDLDHFEESFCRIHHSHTMKFIVCFRFLFVSEFVWTYQVNAWSVPRNDFWSGLRWKQTYLLITILACCPVFAVLADTHTCGFESNPCVVLRCSMVSSSLCSSGCINVKWCHSAHLCCKDLGT